MMENSAQMSLMNFSQMANDKNTKIKFNLVTNDEIPEGDLKIAYETLLEKFPYKKNIRLISEEECLALAKNDITPENVFIMEKFEGAAFRHIEDMQNVFILGVKAFCTAFLENINIPMPICHVHNLSLKNTYFCFARLNEKEKARFQKLVHYMGGQYSSSLRECTTHLITEDIFCAKYVHANVHMMKVSRPAFMEDLWKRSQDFNFKYDQADAYYKQFNVPIFHGVNASSTGIDTEGKKKLMEALQSNGGEFDQTFKTRSTNILFMPREQINSAKAQAAFKYKIRCVTPDWVVHSIIADFALDLDERYLIEKSSVFKASTPEKDTTAVGKFHGLDSTALSDITVTSAPQHMTLEETQYEAAAPSSNHQRKTPSNSSAAKKTVSPAVSAKNDTFKRPPAFVRESRSSAAASTTVGNSITSIRSNERAASTQQDTENETESHASEDDESYIQFMTGKNVFIYGYNEEAEILQMMRECEKYGANVVDATFNKTVDYVITNSNVIEHDEPKMKYKTIVNDYWLEESVAEAKIIEPKYYHQPLYKKKFANVLEDEIFALSGQEKDREQPFVTALITNLGGASRLVLNKKESPILICQRPEGRKYFDGVLKWNLTSLRAEWLLECYKNQMRYDETDFLVGETAASLKNKKKNRDSIIPSSQGQQQESESISEAAAMEVDYQDDVEPYVPKRVAELRPRALESPQTPKTPGSPADGILSLSAMCADMPTPQRELTKATIREGQAQNISPRAQRQMELLKTPGPAQVRVVEESSPMPQIPETMQPTPIDQGIRPDASPAGQWKWKMKFDVLDKAHQHKSDSTKKGYREGLDMSPYEEKRHNFFAARIPGYKSPDQKSGAHFSQDTMADNPFNIFKFTEKDLSVVQQAQMEEEDKVVAEMKAHDREERELRRGRKLDMDDEELENKDNGISWAPENYQWPQYPPKKNQDSEKTLRNSSRSSMSENQSNRANVPTENSIKVTVEETQDDDDDDDDGDNGTNDLDSSENESDFVEAPLEREKKTYKNDWAFGVSGSNEEKAKLIEKIKQLGGKTSDVNFNCLIMPKIAKSSRYFCALARGSFVLHPDFVQDSVMAGRFLNMELYEFGNPKFKCKIPANTSVSAEVINGPYICRQAVLNNPEKYKNGLFTGMNFIVIAAAKEKRQIFCTVINSGGGIVVDEKPEFKAAVLKREKINYCLIDQQNALSSKDIKTCNACNVIVKNVRFIYDHLLSKIQN